jgi:tetratricopeptide (TPR) repeat protein
VPTSLEHDPTNATASSRVFVGRKPELVALRSALDRSLAGRGAVVLVAGEPGIGKSELADRLATEAAARGAQVLWGRSWEGEGAPPYWAWAQIIRAVAEDRDHSELQSLFGAATPYVAQMVPDLGERLGDLPAPSAVDSEQARFRLFDSITTFLRSMSEARPLVLVLDDLHWADKSSLLLLRFVARELAYSRIFIIGTYRDVEVSPGHPLSEVLPSLRQERTVERLLLRGLPEEDVREMLDGLRGGDVPDPLARAISRETEGNPFFVQEIFRHLIDEGLLVRETGEWTSRSRIEDMRLPESVRDVIGRRLQRLSPACTKLLTTASAVGTEFGLDALGKIAELEEERVLELLEDAIAVRVVEEAPQSIGRYRFSHSLIRMTLYEGLRTLDRVRVHGHIAAVFETLYGGSDAHLPGLAHHFLEALPGGDARKAVDYAVRAGDRANEQLAYDEAAVLYERALQALELADRPDEKFRCQVLLKQAEARSGAGRRALETFVQVSELAERLAEPDLLARAALGLAGAGVYMRFAYGDTQVKVLERAFALLDERDSALRAEVMACLASRRVFLGDPQEGGQLARAAIDMARRVGDKRALVTVLNTAPWATWGLHGAEQRLQMAEELIRLAEEIGDARRAADGHWWKTRHYLEMGDVRAEALEMEAAERLAEGSRHAVPRWVGAMTRAARAFMEGRFDEAENETRLGQVGELWGSEAGDVSRGILALLREQQGRADELLPDLERFSARYPKVPAWRVALAVHRMSSGQIEEARRQLEVLAAKDFADFPRDLMWLYSMSRTAELVCMLGDSRRAAILYDLLLPYAAWCAPAGSVAGGGSVSRALGSLATVLARYHEAEKHFEKALGVNAKVRARIWVAHTQQDYARMLLARGAAGDREKADALSAQALATAREVGMKPLEAKSMELRAAAGFGEESPAASPMSPTRAVTSIFRRDGDFWTIHYEGKPLRMRDAKGLQYIARLLRSEGSEVHVAELAAGDAAPEARADRGDAGEILDPQARTEYKQRIEDLEADLDEATRWDDSGRAARAREEIEFLKEELSAAFGLGGRARTTGNSAERARKAVASRMQDTIAKIRKEHPALALHLTNSIRMGTFCCYAPERPTRWQL